MALGKDYARQDCSLARALEVVGERWTLLIVRDAFYGVRRFSDFATHLDIPKAVLAARLQSLVEHGLLDKTGNEYVLTATGRELWPAVHALARWGERHFTDGQPRRLFVHALCGTRVDEDGRCTTCDATPAAQDLEIHPGPGMNPNGRTDAVAEVLRTPHRFLDPIAAD